MQNKVILVVLDGLNQQVAREGMGYLNGLVEQQKATYYPITSELPSLSRPLYECLLTGVTPIESGIVHNHVVRLSHHESVFSLAAKQSLTTAAAAYHWVSELYNRAPYDAKRDRHTHDQSLNIHNGIFYHWDHYPDEALFLDAEYLRHHYDPDFLLVHSMNIDDAGHRFGLNSAQYRNSARYADVVLSDFMPTWIAMGYQVLVTSDHGMNDDKSHGGLLAEERQVPLYVAGKGFSHQSADIKQTEICGLICQLLGLEHHKLFNPQCLL
ncbi:Type I phosphodiesterase / nucleotide pyrophosphatase [Vibrio xiamenensis]|uniref:Type I phosphodiesterase / nucleotide pyrophosphatase n=1 Tax=Vibrio xiamenensis TaxID=861298 RepID=A0A1G7WZ95_9VIBR|nr:alkaline phosphatase family protein [Vibrio xiamenensis]SDG77235.1 Type I phosphodiesterase / nucleotide pyrophosphatase [Vibrio xiamenensis]SDG88621.1 Type I phosphodiesterase / nucleotide pyrophosphatase [Vibrio xiamenensis]